MVIVNCNRTITVLGTLVLIAKPFLAIVVTTDFRYMGTPENHFFWAPPHSSTDPPPTPPFTAALHLILLWLHVSIALLLLRYPAHGVAPPTRCLAHQVHTEEPV